MEGTNKTPLVLELQVPSLCSPILVGDPKGGILRWVERPSKNNTVMSWGLPNTEEEIVKAMLYKALEFSSLWGIRQKSLESARARMNQLGIEDVVQNGQFVVPSDPGLLGTLVYVGDKIFPVIHNISRGFCVLDTTP